jgi:hypothetical protein
MCDTQAFSIFDADGNGEIDIGELSNIMQKLGQPLENEQLKVREELAALMTNCECVDVTFPSICQGRRFRLFF